jgi:hypothetical protein
MKLNLVAPKKSIRDRFVSLSLIDFSETATYGIEPYSCLSE